MELFSPTWTALREAVATLPDRAFAAPSGCAGWLVQDLVCHLVIDAQDVLITLATPAETAPTADALSYWTPSPIGSPSPTRTPRCCATTSRTWAPPPIAPRHSPTPSCRSRRRA